MTHHTTTAMATAAEDRRLALSIAGLMRIGTVIASALLVVGATIAYLQPGLTATILLACGCSLLVLLPVIRLVMMAGHFVRLTDKGFVVITLTVLALVVAGGVVGMAL
ncbi:hypothetical protein [Brevibacterium yomogidense]|uniref:hypothetical protein n=1 Tax=Brevibacterium yomogidense TaxID=946573 RepID=UPI0018DF3F46|nr:hypothetical protein [Brevibacterium yomogidense]